MISHFFGFYWLFWPLRTVWNFMSRCNLTYDTSSKTSLRIPLNWNVILNFQDISTKGSNLVRSRDNVCPTHSVCWHQRSVKIAKYICPNCQIYLSNFQIVYFQIIRNICPTCKIYLFNLVRSSNSTTRILQYHSFFSSFSVTPRVPPPISGTKRANGDPLVSKQPDFFKSFSEFQKKEIQIFFFLIWKAVTNLVVLTPSKVWLVRHQQISISSFRSRDRWGNPWRYREGEDGDEGLIVEYSSRWID